MIAFLLPFVLAALVAAETQLACLSSVSGGSNQGTYLYQSPLYCRTQCTNYPYLAITSGNVCICLSTFPQGSSSNQCNVNCFGALCGGSLAYSIYASNGQGSITAPVSVLSVLSSVSSSSSSTQSSPLSTTQTTLTSLTSTSSTSTTSSSTSSQQTSTVVDATSVVVKTITSDSPSKTASSSSSRASSTSSSSPSSSSSAGANSNSNKSKSSNTGAIVGGVVGGIAGIAIIAIILFFVLKRRNSEDDDEKDFVVGNMGPSGFDQPTYGANTARSNTNKSKKGVSPLDMPMTNPFDHPNDLTTLGVNTQDRLTDPRLNPVMMGRKRLSEGSLADDTDYSRKILHVANPEY